MAACLTFIHPTEHSLVAMHLTQRQLEEMIRAHGLRMTPQRRDIAECLESAPNHPTAEDIFSHVNRLYPMTSRATVYNTLHLLKTARLVQEVFENGQARK
jgi:Fur family peroxide stress response transcriptional regulator